MPATWTCPGCTRTFRRVNQWHSCGVGRVADLLKGKPEPLAALFREMETKVRRWKGVEVLPKGRYALLRTTRIFADVVFMRDVLRICVLLEGFTDDPIFFKSGRMSARRVGQVAMVKTRDDLRRLMPHLKEAHAFALRE